MKYSIKDVTYLSIFPNLLSEKKNSDIDSIIKLANCHLSNLDFFERRVYTCKLPQKYPKNIIVKKIDEIGYNDFTSVAAKYGDFFDSNFMLNFHCDAFIINPDAWTDDFLDYDFVGPLFDAGGSCYPCSGNGGFSLRSKKFCDIFKSIFEQLPESWKRLPEDFLCCYVLRAHFEKNGLKFAPIELASKFATEHLAFKQEDFYECFGIHELTPVSRLAAKEEFNISSYLDFVSEDSKKVESFRLKKHSEIFNNK